MTTATMRRLHDGEGAPDGATSGRARELALRRGGSGGWRYHDEGALVGATPSLPGAGYQARLAGARRARGGEGAGWALRHRGPGLRLPGHLAGARPEATLVRAK